MNDRIRLELGQIIAIERDVQFADRNGNALDGEDIFCQTLCERQTAAFHAEQDDVLRAVIMFNDLMGDAFEGAAHILRCHEFCFYDHRDSSMFLHDSDIRAAPHMRSAFCFV